MSLTSARAQARRRLLAAIVAFGTAVGLLVAPAPERTEANWVDSEHAVSSELTALRLQPPIITDFYCGRGFLGLLLGRLDVTWTLPPSTQVPGATVSIVWSTSQGTLSASPTVSGPNGNGEYSTSFTSGLLTDLLSLILGNSGEILMNTRVAFPGGGVWTSQNASRIEIRTGLSGTTCNAVNGA